MHAITGKLTKPAHQFQAGESVGFGIRLGVKYRDPKTKQDEWTNYQAAIFAKSPNQIAFYQSALVEGAIVTVTAEQLKIDSFEGQQGTLLSIDMLNARLSYVFNPNQQAPQQPAGYQQQPQQAPMQQQQQAPIQQQGYQQRGNYNPDGSPMNPQQMQHQMQGGAPNQDVPF
jgi:single-strand DNA-binding protein